MSCPSLKFRLRLRLRLGLGLGWGRIVIVMYVCQSFLSAINPGPVPACQCHGVPSNVH